MPSHIPISLFIHGKLEINLTGTEPLPGGFCWSASVGDPSVASATLKPVKLGPLAVKYWEFTIQGLKPGQTEIHVQESQATYPPNIRHSFTIDLTVNGLLE